MDKTKGIKTQEETEAMIKVVDEIVEEHYRAKAIDDYFANLERNVLQDAGIFDIDYEVEHDIFMKEHKAESRRKVIGTALVGLVTLYIARLITLVRRGA